MERRPLAQVFLGVLIVTVGVIALLNALDVLDVSVWEILGTWWPMVIVAVGLTALLSVPRAWIGPAGVIAVGLLLQLTRLDMVEVDVWEILWPVAIILVGLSLFTRLGSRGTTEDVINSAVMWWGSERRTTSQSFRGGSLSAVMGGIDVDLRQAGIVDRAEISIFVFWGGVEVKVPPTWRVTVTGLPILGGWDDKTVAPLSPDAPQLLVHITAVMGGAEIKN